MSYVGNSRQREKKVKVQSFTDLYAWKEGHKLVIMTYEATKKFPRESRRELAHQLNKAAASITSNIAEGFRRRTKNDKTNFYTIALSSVAEVQNQMLIAKDVHYVAEEHFNAFAQQSVLVSKLINGLIKAAQTRP